MKLRLQYKRRQARAKRSITRKNSVSGGIAIEALLLSVPRAVTRATKCSQTAEHFGTEPTSS